MEEDVSKKHDATTDEDLKIMYSSGVLSNDSPTTKKGSKQD